MTDRNNSPTSTELPRKRPRKARSLTRRLLFLSSIWMLMLLLLGGVGLGRIVEQFITESFDEGPERALSAMISAAELGPFGEVRFNRNPVEPRFSEPYSGFYWQVSADGHEPFRSRSLWDRELPFSAEQNCITICTARFEGFLNEPLRIIERDIVIPGSLVTWRFAVARSAEELDVQLASVRQTLWVSLGALGAGLMMLAALQATLGLLPLRRVSAAMAAIRAGSLTRAPVDDVPPEISPVIFELNALLDHNEKAAEASRMHAGNLAHALKTPMSVLMNEASADPSPFARTVVRELSTMRRYIDHHLARARATGRRTTATARTDVWPTLERLISAIERIYIDKVVIDLAGARDATFRGERQDLEEMAGNLIDNAAKYGGGRVFVTVEKDWEPINPDGSNGPVVRIIVEDDGPGIPTQERERLFERGARLDTGKPGTGLGLAIGRDVAEIYGGYLSLQESEDLGGVTAILTLPAASTDTSGA